MRVQYFPPELSYFEERGVRMRVQTFGVHANCITDIDLRNRGLHEEHLAVVIAALAELPVLNLLMQGMKMLPSSHLLCATFYHGRTLTHTH